MIEPAESRKDEAPVEAILQEELDQGDLARGTIAPVLGHLLASTDNSMFSDEIVVRVRTMIEHVAAQLLRVHAETLEVEEARQFAIDHAAPFGAQLARDPALLHHVHALALEWQLSCRLEAQSAIDLVLSPLLQSLIAADDESVAETAMALLAAQARFTQAQRRMELPLSELPGDLLHRTLANFSDIVGDTQKAEARIRDSMDERTSRLGLLSRVTANMGPGARAALNVQHSGVALFLTALADLSGQTREVVVASTGERQLARLALGLRAAGLRPSEIEEQFMYVHPDFALPEGFEHLRVDRAATMIAQAGGGHSAP